MLFNYHLSVKYDEKNYKYIVKFFCKIFDIESYIFVEAIISLIGFAFDYI